MTIRRFEDIEGWQMARELTRRVYAVARQGELYVALDNEYITPSQFNSIYVQAADTHAKIGGFIHYLLKSTATHVTPKPRTKHQEPST